MLRHVPLMTKTMQSSFEFYFIESQGPKSIQDRGLTHLLWYYHLTLRQSLSLKFHNPNDTFNP